MPKRPAAEPTYTVKVENVRTVPLNALQAAEILLAAESAKVAAVATRN